MARAKRRHIIQQFLESEPPTEEDLEYLDSIRPKTRADCIHGLRPCPFVGCRYHLYLEVGSGKQRSILPNFQKQDPTQLKYSCALDFADRHGPSTLEETGRTLNITRERVRQIQKSILQKFDSIIENESNPCPDLRSLKDFLQKEWDQDLTREDAFS